MNTLILLSGMLAGQLPSPSTFHSPAPIANKGDVKAGPPLVHTFTLAHSGKGTVTITKVEAGCGCLRRTLGETVLQPGQKTTLALEVNTLTQPDGPNRWQIVVGFKVESPGTPVQTGEVLLQISATLSRDITVDPPQIAFSTTGEASKALVITDKRAKPLNVVKAVSSSTYLTAEVSPAAILAPGHLRTQSVKIKLAGNAPAAHRDETVTLYTDDPTCPELHVPVRVLKRSNAAVRAIPENVTFRPAAGQTEGSTLVQLRSHDGKPLKIDSADSDNPGVKVKWSTGSGPVATVRIIVPEAVLAQSGQCTVRVRFTEPGGEVAIPVSWTGVKK